VSVEGSSVKGNEIDLRTRPQKSGKNIEISDSSLEKPFFSADSEL
jgi:hypothetical protein